MASFNYLLSVTGDCQNTNSGSIAVAFAGGTPPYTVNWQSPINITQYIYSANVFSAITNLSASTYFLRVNDSSVPTNLSYDVNVPVSSGNCVSIIDVSATTCNQNNGSVSVSSSSLYSQTIFNLYNFSGNLINTLVTSLSQTTFQGLSAGTYYIQGIDFGGCTGTSETFIVNPSVELDYGFYVVDDTQCSGPTGKIYVTGQTGFSPYTYEWSNGATGSTITGLTSGTYSVKVTDAAGCQKIKQTSVGQIDQLGLALFSVDSIPTCLASDGALTLTITGGAAPYYYSASTGDIEVTYSKSFQITNIPVGTYNFSVTDAAFCKFFTSTFLGSPQSITDIQIQTIQAGCSNDDGSIQIVVFGGTPQFTYTLIYPDASESSINSNSSQYSFNGLAVGTYTIVIEDSTGCFYSTEKTIVGENAFTLNVLTTGTTCSATNGYIYVEKTTGGTAPFTYSLDNISNITNTSSSAVTFTNVSAGQHQIKVTDALGCAQIVQSFVQPSPALTFNLFSTTCGTGSEGTITAFISNGTPPFQFYWSDNVVGNPQSITVTGLSAGTYSLVIIDDTGCSQTRNVGIDCRKSFASYQTFLMGERVFSVISGTKRGLLQLLNEGFDTLTQGKNNCLLSSATFVAQVQIQPAGISLEQEFFTTTNLTTIVPENLWYNTVETLLESIQGIGSVEINQLTSEIQIKSDPSEASLNNQEVIIELIIIYDIICSS